MTTYDLLAAKFDSTDGKIVVAAGTTTPTGSSQLCTGLVKLAQRVCLELLTERGSVAYRPSAGTDFMKTMRSGRVRTELDVFSAFSMAVSQLEQNLSKLEEEDDEDDERYSDLTLTSVTIASGLLTLGARLTSRAGVGADIELPVASD